MELNTSTSLTVTELTVPAFLNDMLSGRDPVVELYGDDGINDEEATPLPLSPVLHSYVCNSGFVVLTVIAELDASNLLFKTERFFLCCDASIAETTPLILLDDISVLSANGPNCITDVPPTITLPVTVVPVPLSSKKASVGYA